ncbi:MAG: hypothetical protein ACNS64_10565, partial [Candidatus Halalkalibacterium sp. M3_1C_030]
RNSSEMNQHPEHTEKHGRHHTAMLKSVETAANAKSDDTFRKAFADISEHLTKALENQNYSEQTLYLQYCPMAVEGTGATWLSATKEIKNPYMGQQMPGCGETKTEI